jgi:hypothetical protein
MVGWCLGLDGRRERDECAKPTVGRAGNLSDGIVAVFSMVRLQETEMRKALQGNNRSGVCMRGGKGLGGYGIKGLRYEGALGLETSWIWSTSNLTH